MKKERRRIKGNNRRTGIVNRCLVLLLAMMICFSCLQVPVMANDTEEETEKQRKVTIYVVSITGNELTYYEIESEEEEETEVEDSEEQSGATETSDSEEKSGELETSDSEEQSGELETSDSEEQSDGADVNSSEKQSGKAGMDRQEGNSEKTEKSETDAVNGMASGDVSETESKNTDASAMKENMSNSSGNSGKQNMQGMRGNRQSSDGTTETSSTNESQSGLDKGNMMRSMADAKVMQIVNSWDEYIGTFTSGKACGTINGCWIMASIQTAEDTAGKWAITNLPSLPGVDGATNYSNQGGSTWAITTNCDNTELAIDFLNATFAGSTELYDTILPGAGALATWLPASESEVYAEPQEFYGGQQVYTLLSEFSGKVPSVDLGVYYTEANTALYTVLANVMAGADIDSELKTATETVEFNMQ